jgi:hypothetical protein
VVYFLYNFHKMEKALLSFINLEKMKERRVRRRTGTGKNTNGAPVRQWMGKG